MRFVRAPHSFNEKAYAPFPNRPSKLWAGITCSIKGLWPRFLLALFEVALITDLPIDYGLALFKLVLITDLPIDYGLALFNLTEFKLNRCRPAENLNCNL